MARVTNNWTIDKDIKRVIELAKKQLPDLLRTEIVDNNILKGKSPVRGGAARYEKYSESYKKQIRGIKRPSPVNLKLTGDLINSLKFTNIPKGLRVEFTDEKAPWHDNGEGKLPQRKLLPTRTGEEFSIIIQRKIKALLDKLIKSVRTN